MRILIIIVMLCFLFTSNSVLSETITFNYSGGITKVSTDNGITWNYVKKFGNKIEINRLGGIKKISVDFGRTWRVLYNPPVFTENFVSIYCSGNYLFIPDVSLKNIRQLRVYDYSGKYITDLRHETTELSDNKIEILNLLTNGVYFLCIEENSSTRIVCKLMINR
ncbi:MAG: T9SS type A sorting domain-containing protein [Candidatus Kapabacteria bacterium]|nr:T9SS type A sorting domain-containing protein [Candidatus Kapabacteria bacterium]